MKQRRISNSPLMDPSVCALVVISPDPEELASHDPGARIDHQRTLSAVTTAAHIASVPAFSLVRSAQEQDVSPPVDVLNPSSHRRFVFKEHYSPWSHRGFVEALAAEDRSILILAGFWLEHQIISTALHALADGYDVCILLDAAPARCPHASQPARERLNQAGATPVVASQVIHEWSIEAPDAAKRVALDSLLSNLMEAE